jgi:hypothetical protein
MNAMKTINLFTAKKIKADEIACRKLPCLDEFLIAEKIQEDIEKRCGNVFENIKIQINNCLIGT